MALIALLSLQTAAGRLLTDFSPSCNVLILDRSLHSMLWAALSQLRIAPTSFSMPMQPQRVRTRCASSTCPTKSVDSISSCNNHWERPLVTSRRLDLKPHVEDEIWNALSRRVGQSQRSALTAQVASAQLR